MRLILPIVVTAATLAMSLAPSAAQADSGRSQLRHHQRNERRQLEAEGDWRKESLRNAIQREEEALDDWRDREKSLVRADYNAAKFHGGMSAGEFLDRMRQIDRTYRLEVDRLDDYGDWRKDQLDEHFDRAEDELDNAHDYERDTRRHGAAYCCSRH